ncbi:MULTISPECIES: RagB/SusD family nutrient uptake outer membrane protein [Sphingobacterium]|uniref:SusD-like starch-binding protein associating with outer membrane n=2 Tax=Sphingobacterium TaxID=28453 RepID=A0A4R6WJJ5_9SPHI|nr:MULTISPECIES: RagB/SusD family nutrient uptake outer membrane protein [Sphingobacterium]TDQ78144.1 SusD-like starch-binding protein associating with outer membrane [Sphingobacterium yanglingense]
MKSIIKLIPVLGLSVWLYSCANFLDAKPDNTLAHPSTLKDLRAILDNENAVNDVYPSTLAMASDEFYMTYKGYAQMTQRIQDIYIWEDQGIDAGWTTSYKAISLANVVLEALERIKGGDQRLRNQLEGEALFLRGWMFFHLAQIYCPHFSIHDTGEGLGIVLRMDSSSEVKIGRSSLKETYRQIFGDLNRALELLPEESEYITRPAKLACYGALARAYLTVEDFVAAEEMVDKLLKRKDELWDYNTVSGVGLYPFVLADNIELIYYGRAASTGEFIYNPNTYIDPALYSLYEEHDLRKNLYYTAGAEGMKFRGYYHGKLADYFGGIGMDEMYLIKAECAARREDTPTGLRYLNTLLQHRYNSDYFNSLTILDSDILLRRTLEERRKQLVCRGLRWQDLRRLNRTKSLETTIHREMEIDGELKVYTLEPNSLRYVFLIPYLATEMGHYEQNPR